jgi:hypothetical protein
MRFYSSVLVFLLIIVTFSCSSSEIDVHRDQINKNKSVKLKVIPNEILVAEVVGMVCKMGCGGLIRKEMIQTNAVSLVEIDYKDKLDKQLIRIHFDNKLISKKQIIRRLEIINNNQFKIYPVGTSEIKSSSSGTSEKSGVNISEKSIELPNLFEIFSSIITE